MLIRLFNFFCLLFLILQATANPNWTGVNPPAFVPDFSGQAFIIPQGTIIAPLCANPMEPSCLSQWGHQAIPLSIQQGLGPSPYQYFLPAFIPSQVLLEDPRNSENWLPYTASFKGYSSGGSELQRTAVRRRKGGKSSSRADKKQETSEEQKEREEPDKKKTEQEGTEVEGESKKASKPEDKAPGNKPEQTQPPKTEEPSRKGPVQAPQEEDEPVYYISKKDPSKMALVNIDASGKVTATGGTVAFISSETLEELVVPDPSLPVSDSQQKESSSGKSSRPDGKSVPPGASIQNKIKTPLYRVRQDSIALPATVKEIKPGCFVINKSESKTEGNHCFECDILKETGAKESEIIDFFKSVSKIVKKKIFDNTYTHNKDMETKICSPESSLKAVIGNFKKTCEMDFSDFFSNNYCKICKKGVPPAVTFALMTVESSGRCKAVGTSGHKEKSVGLFQINANAHQCTPNHGKGTSANAACLMKIDNNFQASINILIEKYNYLNKANVQTDGGCKSWLKIPDTEREAWRKAVSGYNSGEAHVKQVLDDIAKKESYTKPIIWEELRAFYFKYPGRRAEKFIKLNMAYTEAILGRETSGNVYGGRGMVEIWTQYIEKKRREGKLPSCSQ